MQCAFGRADLARYSGSIRCLPAGIMALLCSSDVGFHTGMLMPATLRAVRHFVRCVGSAADISTGIALLM